MSSREKDSPPPVAGGAATDDVITQVKVLAANKYQLRVTNVSGVGYLDTFSWTPPQGVTIAAVTSSEGARCQLVDNNISCTGKIAPPSCTCEAGGSMTVNFIATGLASTFADGYETSYGVVGSFLQVTSVTPVPYHIPSYISGRGV